MTEFTTWKDSDDVAPLRGSATGHALILPRAHHREDTVGAPHPLQGPHREDIAAEGLVPVLQPGRTGRIRSLKPPGRKAPPLKRAVEDPPKLHWTTTEGTTGATGTTLHQVQVTKRTSAALCPGASEEPTSLEGWKNPQHWTSTTGPRTPTTTFGASRRSWIITSSGAQSNAAFFQPLSGKGQ